MGSWDERFRSESAYLRPECIRLNVCVNTNTCIVYSQVGMYSLLQNLTDQKNTPIFFPNIWGKKFDFGLRLSFFLLCWCLISPKVWLNGSITIVNTLKIILKLIPIHIKQRYFSTSCKI